MKINWIAILTLVAGGGLAALAGPLGALFPKQAQLFTTLFSATGLLAIVAGIILQALQPAAKIVQDAPVVNAQGSQVATNISSTSTVFQKGTNP